MTPTIQCAHCRSDDATRPLAALHADTTADAALRAAVAPPVSPARPAGQIGCGALVLSGGGAALLGVAAALASEWQSLASGIARTPEEHAAGLMQSSAFSGAAVFMFAFIALFGVFIWRHMRTNVVFALAAERWVRAARRYEVLGWCASCGQICAPGELTMPPEHLTAYLYDGRRERAKGDT
jgi:hypothetical protein